MKDNNFLSRIENFLTYGIPSLGSLALIEGIGLTIEHNLHQ